MRTFGQKAIINLVIVLIKVLTFLKRGIFSLSSVLIISIIKIGAKLSKIIILPFYRLYLPIKKKFQIFFEGSSRNKFFYIFSYPKSINALIILITILVAVTNINAQGKEQTNIQGSSFFILFNDEEEITEEAFLEEGNSLENYFSDIGSIKPSLQTGQESESEIEAINLICFFDNSFLFKPFIPITRQTPRARTKTETYLVQPGDTISDISEKFGLWASTILWENNLSAYSIIKPGQKLSILPINGVTYKIKKGDTVKLIAKEFKAKEDEIIQFNKLDDANALSIGEFLIIPGGAKYIAPQIKKTSPRPTIVTGKFKSHIFPWGQCTLYVAQKKYVPWSGNAKNWLANAKRYGLEIGNAPRVGAIVALKESGWQARRYGHVAYVEEIEKNKIIISEMNYKGVGVYSKRSVPINSKKIIGYIY